MTLEELYHERCKQPEDYADIWEHVERLSKWAQKVTHITEFGVRSGNSTVAFLHGLSRNGGSLFSYDIEPHKLRLGEMPTNVFWAFNKQDTSAPHFQIQPTDLLFLDSCHKYPHVKAEFLQADQVRKYIMMHDVSPLWIGGCGPLRAMTEFLDEHANWKLIEFHDNCNGLAILERLY